MSLNLGIIASSRQQAAPLLLDLYPNAAAAYSLRKLRTAYTGSAIRVRRTDNAEIDIGFVNGVLDTNLISTFCGASEGFVTIWYDQSGIGVNAIQSTSSAQPKIFSFPNFYLQNGKPSIKFSGTTSCNLRRTGTMPLIERSFAFVGKQDFYQQDAGVFGFAPSGGGNDFNSPDTFIFQTANSSVPADYYVVGSTGASYFLPQNGPGTTEVLQYGLYLENKTTSVGELYRNNSLIAQDSSFTQFDAFNTQSLVLGARQFNSSLLANLFAGIFQEFVYWSVSNTANRLGIQNNINSYYSIYPVPPVVSDPDAQAFVNRVYAAGGTLTSTEANAVNTLTIDLKANGIWTLMKAIYPMVGASAAACAQNLKSSSFTGTFSGAVTYASTGVTSNGTNGYMNTNLNSSTHLSLNNLHVSVYIRNNVQADNCDIGNYNGAGSAITIYSRTSGNTQYTRLHDENNGSITITDSRGFRLGSRLSSTAKINVNNSTITPISANSVALINANIYLMALNNSNLNNTPSQYTTREVAFASIGDGLTNTQVSDFYTAIQAFQTTLSRQV